MSELLSNDQYIEKKWATLSPKFREAHNRLRRIKGMPSIPEPKIDLYVPPRGPSPAAFDPASPEGQAAARTFLGRGLMAPGAEGFTVNGRSDR